MKIGDKEVTKIEIGSKEAELIVCNNKILYSKYCSANNEIATSGLVSCTLTIDLPATKDTDGQTRATGTVGFWNISTNKFVAN